MKFWVVATLAAVLVTSSAAADRRKIVVCIQEGGLTEGMNDAMEIVSKIFIPAHLRLEWHGEKRFCEKDSDRMNIIVSLSNRTPRDVMPQALAFALPNESRNIVVFYDRISCVISDIRRALLAHVIAHEITHILQSVCRHSEEGIMKARWDYKDFALMKLSVLQLTATDLQLIREGLAVYDLRVKRAKMTKPEFAVDFDIARPRN